jgi:uncharacterized lipoprotein YehR (DUF1307 family)
MGRCYGSLLRAVAIGGCAKGYCARESERKAMRYHIRQLIAALLAAVLVFSVGGCGFIKVTNNAISAKDPVANNANEAAGGRGGTSGAGGSTADKNPSLKALEIIEYGYSIIEMDGTYYVSYGIIVKNPNTQGLANQSLKMTLRDADGKVLEASSIFCQGVAGGDTTGIGNYTVVTAGKPTKLELSAEKPDSYQAKASGILKTTDLAFSDARHLQDEYTSKITGDVTNRDSQEYSDVQLNIILRSSDGKIVGGVSDYLDSLPPGTVTAFDVFLSSYSTPPGFTDFELFASAVLFDSN